MPSSEEALYDKFVTRSLREVQVGLELDNNGDGSHQKRVSDALKTRTENGTERCAAQKVIDGRFILGGNDASYLASGLAVLWSTVGHPVDDVGNRELSLAPAALYSPEAVNGIRRGLIAAMEKRNEEMRQEAPNMIANLMAALVPLLPFLYDEEGDKSVTEDAMRRFLMNGELTTVEERNKLFKFLVRAKSAIHSAGEGELPTSQLAAKILQASTSRHQAALEAKSKECQATKQRLEGMLADANKAADKMQESYEAELREKDRDFAAAKQKHVREVAALTAEIGRKTAEISRLDQEIMDKQAENLGMLQKVRERGDVMTKQTAELETRAEELKVCKGLLAELKASLEIARGELEQKRAEHEQVEREHEAFKAKHAEEMQANAKRLSVITDKNKTLKSAAAATQKESETREKEYETKLNEVKSVAATNQKKLQAAGQQELAAAVVKSKALLADLNARLEKANAANMEADEQIKRCKSKYEKAMTSVRAKKSELLKSGNDRAELQKRLEECLTALRAAQKQLDDQKTVAFLAEASATQKVDALNAEKREADEQLAKEEALKKSSAAEILNLRSALKEQDEELRAKQAELEQCKEEARNSVSLQEAAVVQARLATLEQLENAEKDKAEHVRALEDLTARVASCQGELSARTEELKQCKAENAVKEAAMRSELEEREQALDKNRQQMSELQANLNEAKELIGDNQKERARLMEDLNQRNEELQGLMKTLTGEKDAAEDAVRACEETLKQKQADLAVQQTINVELRLEVDECKRKLKKCTEENERISKVAENYKGLAAKMNDKVERMQTEKATMDKEVEKMETDKSALELNMELGRAALMECENAIYGLQAELNKQNPTKVALQRAKELRKHAQELNKSLNKRKEVDQSLAVLLAQLQVVLKTKPDDPKILEVIEKNEAEQLKNKGAIDELEDEFNQTQSDLNILFHEMTNQVDPEDDGPAYVDFIQASGDSWIDTAVLRGLVGQRGPTEPAAVDACPADALLPYALPDINDVVKHLLPAHLLLRSTLDPTTEEVDAATTACAACEHVVSGEAGGDGDGAKRRRLSQCAADLASPAVASEAMALFQDNFAIIGKTPAASLPEERCGVELPHEVRWMPHGPRGSVMARVAVLEHAAARCVQVAAQPGVRATVASALRHAATALKLQQLAPLYELHEAAEYDDDPHPLGTGSVRLVTRPCAVVRGTLSFPTDAGVGKLAEGSNNAPLTQDASLAQAMGSNAVATATLRNDMRRQGLPSNVYVAPKNSEMAFHSAPTGVTAKDRKEAELKEKEARVAAQNEARAKRQEGEKAAANAPLQSPEFPSVPNHVPTTTSEQVSSDMYSNDTFLRIVNRLIVAAAAHAKSSPDCDDPPDPVAAFLDASKSERDGAGVVNPQTRREGLWTEMHRHVAISQDRLWIFIRLMSGKIGGNISEVITLADEATLKAAKAIQEQRLEIAKRVSDMQSKIVETVVASMLKNSNMTMDYTGDNLAVIDAEARKDLKDLSTGASGRPFFEANVALKNLSERSGDAPQLQKVLAGLANVGAEMQTTLERTLAEPSAASASLVEMSHPSNSYFVSMRSDAVAAIREAQEKLNCEMGVLGGARRLMLWELVEGGCSVLVQRFAELCGFLLVQARTSTGVSAMYVSHQSVYTNASQTRVALSKLVSAAMLYTARVATPKFDATDTDTARFTALTQGERVRDIDITSQRIVPARHALRAPISSSGYWVEGGRR